MFQFQGSGGTTRTRASPEIAPTVALICPAWPEVPRAEVNRPLSTIL